MLDHRARVAIHRHIMRSAERGRIVRVAQLASAVAKRYGIAESEAEAEIVSQAVLENVGLQLGRDRPMRQPVAQARRASEPMEGAKFDGAQERTSGTCS